MQVLALAEDRITATSLGTPSVATVLPQVLSGSSPDEEGIMQLLVQYQDIISQSEDDISSTHLAGHSIHSEGPHPRYHTDGRTPMFLAER